MMMRTMMWLSKLTSGNGRFYMAEQPHKGGTKLLWSFITLAGVAGFARLEVALVPRRVRQDIYKQIERTSLWTP